VLAAGVAGFCAWVFALGSAAAHLMPAGDSPARVSIAAGAWLAIAGVAIVWFAGNGSVRSSRQGMVGVVVAAAAVFAAWSFGGLSQLSLAYEYRAQATTFWPLVASHIGLSLAATAIAAVLGVALGIAAARTPLVRSAVIGVAGVVQTVPSLALYGLLIIPLGMLHLPTLGTVPALIALTLYALLPVVRNTYLGVSGVDPAVIDAGRGMGMGRGELLWRVEMPLALPLVLEGLRAALVMTIGIAAVMAIAGAQNLGTLVFLGFGSIAPDLVLLGAVPMVLLAIVADQAVRALERLVVSPGIRPSLASLQEGAA
jgi:osmoprotectant transport system permease protein